MLVSVMCGSMLNGCRHRPCCLHMRWGSHDSQCQHFVLVGALPFGTPSMPFLIYPRLQSCPSYSCSAICPGQWPVVVSVACIHFVCREGPHQSPQILSVHVIQSVSIVQEMCSLPMAAQWQCPTSGHGSVIPPGFGGKPAFLQSMAPLNCWSSALVQVPASLRSNSLLASGQCQLASGTSMRTWGPY